MVTYISYFIYIDGCHIRFRVSSFAADDAGRRTRFHRYNGFSYRFEAVIDMHSLDANAWGEPALARRTNAGRPP